MKSRFSLTSVLLAGGVVFGLLAVAGAILAAHAWSVVIGILGLVLAGRCGVSLAKRFGATEQPQ